MANDSAAQDLCAVLERRQLRSGGWAALPFSVQASLEPTALAYIALSAAFGSVHEKAREFLIGTQNPNGSWPAFAGDDKEGSWTTSLVLIALSRDSEAIAQRLKGFEWLIQSTGEESNWLWKWKFRTTDRHVRFDPDKFGWPWIPRTNSWVVPTAFSILALDQFSGACDFADRRRRIRLGLEMLLDRACPGGGWNAGNGVVYGSAMAPHPDDTAIALLALGGHEEAPIRATSVDWLERVAPRLNSAWSLAWCILALAANRRLVDSLVRRLSQLLKVNEVDTGTLAVSSLAFEREQTLGYFSG